MVPDTFTSSQTATLIIALKVVNVIGQCFSTGEEFLPKGGFRSRWGGISARGGNGEE